MAWKNLFVSNGATLRTEYEQLMVKTDQTYKIPIEDINSIVLENLQSMISIYTLMKLVKYNVTVYICDQKHLPCALLLPYSQNSRYLEVIRAQESLSELNKKQLWKQIVIAKVQNQAQCLQFLQQHENAKILRTLSKKVISGDATNIEALAANIYFKFLFGKEFNRRNDEDSRNGLLNYGYAIIRGHIARVLAGYGFLLMKGVHHKSVQNSYNLVDDFIEPFRPLVDLFVSQNPPNCILDTEVKGKLYNLLNMDILINQKHYSVSYAIEIMVQSFSRYCFKNSNTLSLPQLLVLKQHRYE